MAHATVARYFTCSDYQQYIAGWYRIVADGYQMGLVIDFR